MRILLAFSVAALALGACSKADKQADALDNAAAQADPAAANAMHNAADQIRAGGSDANLSDPSSPAQAAMASAGAAAANSNEAPPKDTSFGTKELVAGGNPTSGQVAVGADSPGASPHKAGQPVPSEKK